MIKANFKYNSTNGVIYVLCGLLFISLNVFLGFKDSEATMGSLLFGFALGALFCFIGIVFLLFNYKAYLYIDNDHIKGKYHWFGKIDCNISDAVFSIYRNNTLIIELKNGKCHTITGIDNPWPFAWVIRRDMPFEVTEKPVTLIGQLNNLKSAKKNGLICVCSGLVLIFANIFVTVFLTGERELDEFSKTDWTVFTIMCVIEITTIIATFYFAQKTGKTNVPMERMGYSIRRRIVETRPLLPGHIIKVFADYNYTGRITVYGYPNDDSIYYIVQEFTPDYELIQIHKSETFENIEKISYYLDFLIDITEKMIKK